jgi:hypothetical protein
MIRVEVVVVVQVFPEEAALAVLVLVDQQAEVQVH